MQPERKVEPLPAPDRLDSWKEIAAYLNRSERTVRRWEASEELPVHRLQHDKRGRSTPTRASSTRGGRHDGLTADSADEPPSPTYVSPAGGRPARLASLCHRRLSFVVLGPRAPRARRARHHERRGVAGCSSGRALGRTPGASRSRPAFAITGRPSSSIPSSRAHGPDWRRRMWR